jgi:predicted DNA-binding transcriptional regulator YafY
VRADRLVAILLMLQARGQVTAAEVAAELEISERTARRDLESLAMAGLPVYSRQGRNGGWQLLGGARTDLSGLTAAEARALFLVAGPASTATPQVKAALRKLLRALPEPFRPDAEAAATAIVVDPTAWGSTNQDRPDPPHLDALQHAVVSGHQIRLAYTDRSGNETIRVVHPFGLAAKRTVWYLVAGTEAGQRTFRVDRVTAVEATGDAVVRPDGFDLAAAWAQINAEVPDVSTGIAANGTATPDGARLLRWLFGRQARIGPPDERGRIPFEVRGEDAWVLGGRLAGLGGRVEVTGPPEVIERLAQIGSELIERYGTRAAGL